MASKSFNAVEGSPRQFERFVFWIPLESLLIVVICTKRAPQRVPCLRRETSPIHLGSRWIVKIINGIHLFLERSSSASIIAFRCLEYVLLKGANTISVLILITSSVLLCKWKVQPWQSCVHNCLHATVQVQFLQFFLHKN